MSGSPPSKYRYDVFLSYSRKDQREAKWLDAQLNARGVRTFLDQKSIDPGAIFEQNIFDDLEASRTYCLIVTPNSSGSDWVHREYSYAHDLMERGRLRIIPLLFETVKAGGPLASHNMLDFRDPSQRAAKLTPLIFPGITKKRLDVWLVNWHPSAEWEYLRETLVAQHGVSETTVHDILRGWNKGEVSLAEDGRRIVAVVGMFGHDWHDSWRILTSVRFIFDVRERTRGKANETVFILFSDLARIDEFRPALVEAVGTEKVERLRNYFQIDPARDRAELTSNIDLIWVRTLKELMDGERRLWTSPDAHR
jgi:hypothetical protein